MVGGHGDCGDTHRHALHGGAAFDAHSGNCRVKLGEEQPRQDVVLDTRDFDLRQYGGGSNKPPANSL